LLGILGVAVRPSASSNIPIAAACGIILGLLTIGLERWLQARSLQSLLTASVGMLLGTVSGLLLVANLSPGSFGRMDIWLFAKIAAPLAGAYVGFSLGLSKRIPQNVPPWVWNSAPDEFASSGGDKILDTSVLIDGRIADIAEAGFLDGRIVIPQFVLYELQAIADSADSARRNRGRRGLDIVRKLQSTAGLVVYLASEDYPGIREVDLKLIQLAKAFAGARIVTNDFNLNKLAQVQGLRVLNINELANSVRPVVLPGETMRVFILKEGKEHNQGVAYLDDGTMVVVDNARRLISKTIDITVTSVLQTTAGKMIFARFDERHGSGAEGRQAAASGSSSAAASASTS
jgi:uncharacterized protein YacL